MKTELFRFFVTNALLLFTKILNYREYLIFRSFHFWVLIKSLPLNDIFQQMLKEMEKMLGCWQSFLLPLAQDPQLSDQAKELRRALSEKGVAVSEKMLKVCCFFFFFSLEIEAVVCLVVHRLLNRILCLLDCAFSFSLAL